MVSLEFQGRQAYQYTALDDCIRLRVVRFFPELTNRAGLAFLAALRTAFPFRISTVQTDHDATFTTWDTGAPKTAPEKPVRLSPFTLTCEAAGIRHCGLRPRSPHLNGKVERSHQIDEEACSRTRRCRTMAELTTAHRRFTTFYHTARPHGGHGGLPPTRAPLRSRPREAETGGKYVLPLCDRITRVFDHP